MKLRIKKDAFFFWLIPVIWLAFGVLSIGAIPFIWGNHDGRTTDLLSWFSAIPPATTAIIGLLHVKFLWTPSSKGIWLAALAGLSILPPSLVHFFSELINGNDPFAVIAFLSIGGLVGIMTWGFIFPGLAPFLAMILFWKFFDYRIESWKRTLLVFLTLSFCWEITILVGIVFGLGG